MNKKRAMMIGLDGADPYVIERMIKQGRLPNLKKVLENVLKLTKENNFEIVSLIKPQFEAGKEQVGKNGVVKEKETHIEVIENVVDYVKSLNLRIRALTYSPIKGPKGNIEYLIYISDFGENTEPDIINTVELAHQNT